MYIFDIDGTLTSSKYGYNPTGKESTNKDVVSTLQRLASQGNTIVLLTGRESKYRAINESWLKAHGIHYDSLYMNNDPHVQSTIYKQSQVRRLIAPGSQVSEV